MPLYPKPNPFPGVERLPSPLRIVWDIVIGDEATVPLPAAGLGTAADPRRIRRFVEAINAADDYADELMRVPASEMNPAQLGFAKRARRYAPELERLQEQVAREQASGHDPGLVELLLERIATQIGKIYDGP